MHTIFLKRFEEKLAEPKSKWSLLYIKNVLVVQCSGIKSVKNTLYLILFLQTRSTLYGNDEDNFFIFSD